MWIIKFLKLYFWQRWRVPKGDYCYKIIWIEHPNDKPPITHTKICPYWKIRKVFGWDEEDGYCTLLDLSDCLIWDQCKSCGIREYKKHFKSEKQ